MANHEPKGRLLLFENTFKKNDSHPVLTGSGEIPVHVIKDLAKWYNDHKADLKEDRDGNKVVELNCAAWTKQGSNGKPYHFVTFEIKKPRENNSISEDGSVSEPKDEDDIPF